MACHFFPESPVPGLEVLSQKDVRFLRRTDWRDVELMHAALDAQLHCRIRVALTETAFSAELDEGPDIIVSDSKTRDFDGLRAFEIARKKRSLIPFVFCSGNFNLQKLAEALKYGAAWAAKENSFQQLVHVIRRLCSPTVLTRPEALIARQHRCGTCVGYPADGNFLRRSVREFQPQFVIIEERRTNNRNDHSLSTAGRAASLR